MCTPSPVNIAQSLRMKRFRSGLPALALPLVRLNAKARLVPGLSRLRISAVSMSLLVEIGSDVRSTAKRKHLLPLSFGLQLRVISGHETFWLFSPLLETGAQLPLRMPKPEHRRKMLRPVPNFCSYVKFAMSGLSSFEVVEATTLSIHSVVNDVVAISIAHEHHQGWFAIIDLLSQRPARKCRLSKLQRVGRIAIHCSNLTHIRPCDVYQFIVLSACTMTHFKGESPKCRVTAK